MANRSPLPTPIPPLKQITFAFPFRKRGQDNRGAAADFTDEHEIFELLKHESSGSFPVSSGGIWHGGIHVTEAGAGQSMDLKGGVRCIADGEVVAWRLNRAYLVNQIPARDGQPAINASYSTGFVLVKHAMEFPRDTTLTFFSLYMHLQDYAGYESDPTLPWPAYWAAKVQVTQDTIDKPQPATNGKTAPDRQIGLNVRPTKGHGHSLGILPQGTQVSLSRRDGDWGQIADAPGALYAPTVGGYVDPGVAIGKWIFLGNERGHSGSVVENVMPDSYFDSVNVVAEGRRVKVKAGDVLGYLGRFDSLRNSTSTRMVHIEVFCDDTINQFMTAGRNWVDAHVEDTIENKNHWNELGVSPVPTILRVNSGVHLYKAPPPTQAGEEPNPTDVIQVCRFATLPYDSNCMVTETQSGNDGHKRTWWRIDSADIQRKPISGWVREQSFAGGMVTSVHAQSWIDFKCHDEGHDPTHTIFANTQDYVDFKTDSEKPSAGSKAKLNPLMAAIHGVLFPTGDGAHAVDELSNIGQSPQDSDFPWVAFRASRLIPKHESEWANPAKWQELVSAIEQHTGPKPEHEEEKKRIANLVWWDAVEAGVHGFPASDVFHIHPIGLVGNFLKVGGCQCKSHDLPAESLKRIVTHATDAKIEEYISALNKAFIDYKFDTCISRAHFLAQILTESGEFLYTRELGKDKKPYDPWRGRGLIQITHKENYQAYQNYCGQDLTSSQLAMEKLEGSPHALLSAAWFYAIQAELLDASNADDFIWIVRKINGGFNGFDDRLAYMNRMVEVLSIKDCLKLNKNGKYRFEESKAYAEKRAAFAWGMWHDPTLGKNGVALKDRAESIKGYNRYIELDDQAGKPLDKHGKPKDQGWYRIGKENSVRAFCESRLKNLN
jgi:predicted chitinase